MHELSQPEFDAVLEAAAWYAKYHHQIIAAQANDRSARAVARRDRFRSLHDALAKLGVPLRRPDGLQA